MTQAPNPRLYRLDEPLSRAQVVDELAAMPRRLRALVQQAPAGNLTSARGTGEWSASHTLCHVRDAALVYSLRFRFIVFNDDPFLADYDEDNWVAAAKDQVEDVPEILNEIAASRADLVRVLRRLPAAAWQRPGRHEVIGPLCLEHYVRHQVAHERMHTEQIRAALNGSP